MTLDQRLRLAEQRAARITADTSPTEFVLPDDEQARDLAERFEARVAELPTDGLTRRQLERLVFADRDACQLANDFARRCAHLQQPTPLASPAQDLR